MNGRRRRATLVHEADVALFYFPIGRTGPRGQAQAQWICLALLLVV